MARVPLGRPLPVPVDESPTAAAEDHTDALHAANPDGVAVDARDLPGYTAPGTHVRGPAASGSGGGARDANGMTLDDHLRQRRSGG